MMGAEHPRPAPDAWRNDAACRGADPDLFFPAKGKVATGAKALCAVCPVVDQCLAYALTEHIKDGIYGGMNYKDRRTVTDEQRAQLGLPPKDPRVARCGTPAGDSRHRRLGEPVCDDCRIAINAYRREYKQRRRTLSAASA